MKRVSWDEYKTALESANRQKTARMEELIKVTRNERTPTIWDYKLDVGSETAKIDSAVKLTAKFEKELKNAVKKVFTDYSDKMK